MLWQRMQVDVAPEFQGIVDAFAHNQVPQINQAELLRLRDEEPLETASSAKELTVDGSGFKVGRACLGRERLGKGEDQGEREGVAEREGE